LDPLLVTISLERQAQKSKTAYEKTSPHCGNCLVGVLAGFDKPHWTLTYFKAMDILYALVVIQEIFFTDSAGEF